MSSDISFYTLAEQIAADSVAWHSARTADNR
jgi:hypothetical protein